MDPSPSRRAEFDALLRDVMAPVNGKTYYQPPATLKMEYPCLVYELDTVYIQSADNGPYAMHDRYQVTLIRHEPDSPVIRELLCFPLSSFSRHFATSGLNHDVFVIYY